MKKGTKTVGELVMNLDTELGSINLMVVTLVDVQEEFGHLRFSMDEAAYRGDEKICFQEFHTQVRILSELMRYSMDELMKSIQSTTSIKRELFLKVKAAQPGVPISSVDIRPRDENISNCTLKEATCMTPEREFEVAMKHNTLAFINEFDKAPENKQEVRDWVSGIVEKVRKEDEKKAHSHCNEE